MKGLVYFRLFCCVALFCAVVQGLRVDGVRALNDSRLIWNNERFGGDAFGFVESSIRHALGASNPEQVVVNRVAFVATVTEQRAERGMAHAGMLHETNGSALLQHMDAGHVSHATITVNPTLGKLRFLQMHWHGADRNHLVAHAYTIPESANT